MESFSENEPTAEFRKQPRETALHSLKILKPENDLQMQKSMRGSVSGNFVVSLNQSRKRKTKFEQQPDMEDKLGVYSQVYFKSSV